MIALLISCTHSFITYPNKFHRVQRAGLRLQDSKNPLEDIAKKAAWSAAEVLGYAAAATSSTTPPSSSSSPLLSFDDAIACLREDYDRDYFLSGSVTNVELYALNCTFSDPFASFDGRDRFISNLSNLAIFVSEYKTKVVTFDVDPSTLKADVRVLVKLSLNLPWNPTLNWVWGVEHQFTLNGDFYQVCTHTERWEIDPWEGVKQGEAEREATAKETYHLTT